MIIDLRKDQSSKSCLSHLLNILLSYVIFIVVIALFGKGYTAISSLIIVLFAASIAVIFCIYKLQSFIFNKNDYLLIGTIFFIQSLIGLIHFNTIINPAYFSSNSLGIDIVSGNNYYDLTYFVWMMDMAATERLQGGYLFFEPMGGYFNKNYLLAYLVSDIYYFGDVYMLNFMAINILSIFYSGVVLALIANQLFNKLDITYQKVIFYLVICQPIAWIPSHTMRDVLGAFIIVLSIALVISSVTNVQKIFFGILSLGLVFQHRSIYFLSLIGSILLNNIISIRAKRLTGVIVMSSILIFIYYIFISDIGLQLSLIFLESTSNSAFGIGVQNRSLGLIEHAVKLIVGPFPWTQYFDGSVRGYSGFYSSIFTLQAASHLTIIYFVITNINSIFSSIKQRHHLYMALFFAIPAAFSLGGHNIYLLPSMLLSVVYLHKISYSRIFTVFLVIVCAYICSSILFQFIFKF